MPFLPFTWVDVFAAAPFTGNQLAVFRTPPDLPDEVLRRVTRELNHSETVFLQPARAAGADHRVRIFIPTLPLAAEIPFAGHPILGAACVAAPQGGLVRLETGMGIVPVTVAPTGEGGELDAPGPWRASMQQPLPRVVRVIEQRAELADALGGAPLAPGLPVEAVDNGMQTVIVPLASLEAVQQARPDLARLRGLLGRAGLCTLVFAPGGLAPDTDATCRVFSPYDLVPEDPATGSANGPLGEYLVRHGVVQGPRTKTEQGIQVGRPSRLEITIERSGGTTHRVDVAGEVHLVGQGQFRIPCL
ncbi:MAG: phenazine biosynthesis protein PhzF [Symbiobacteriaceae bacterium]|nr:phenazine biosynthesis protein PhzF [Symbiobacteriaceae bacterium]